MALAELTVLAPGSPQWLVGISLGGNVAFKLAGELPVHPVPTLTRVAAIAPPIDLPRCAELLLLPRNRVYERRFLRALLRDAVLRQRYFPDLPPLKFPESLTVVLFDEHYTAPRNGFAGGKTTTGGRRLSRSSGAFPFQRSSSLRATTPSSPPRRSTNCACRDTSNCTSYRAAGTSVSSAGTARAACIGPSKELSGGSSTVKNPPLA